MRSKSGKIIALYNSLLKRHGRQGWWPINGKYHPNNYSQPRNEQERLEICVGAILTQNTSWKNVEKALNELRKNKILSRKGILKAPTRKLAKIIRSSGYHNQKARKLKIFAAYIGSIGPETADSILLYAYKKPFFVIDSYTKRVMAARGLCNPHATYDEMQKIFHASLPKDYKLYNEFHALIVEEAKLAKKAGIKD